MTRRVASALLLLALPAAAALAAIPIRGRIGAGGAPLAGATVELLPVRGTFERGVALLAGQLDPEPAAAATSGADGAFELVAPALGLWAVRSSRDGYVAMEYRLSPLVEPIELPPVDLRPDAGLEVAVRDAGGRPVSGARLIARSLDRELWRPRAIARRFWLPATRRAIAGEDGVARLSRAAGEQLAVTAFAPGFVPPDPVKSSNGAVEVTVRSGRERILSVRRAPNVPVEGVLVLLGEPGWAAGVTNAEGRLTVAQPPEGEIFLQAESEEGATARLRAAPDPSDPPAEIELWLEEPLAVSGRVVDAESGEPVAGAFVWENRAAHRGRKTDRAGGFRISIDRGSESLYIQAAAAGYFQGWVNLQDDTVHQPVIALQPGAAIEGRVITGDGEPVAGAELTATPASSDLRGPRTARYQDPAWGRSGEDGDFRLLPVVPGVVLRLVAAKAGFAPAEVELPLLEPREVRAGVELVLAPGLRITGRVLAASGERLADAELTLHRAPSTPSPFVRFTMPFEGPAAEARSDAEGGFELADLAPGRYRLAAAAPGYARLVTPGIEVSAGVGPVDLGDLVLEPGVEVRGVVVDTEGRAIPGAEIRVVDPRGRGPLAVREPTTLTSGADGGFNVVDLRRGETIDLHVEHCGFSRQRVPGITAPTRDPVRIVLERAFGISGVVVGPDGSPVAKARVRAHKQGGGVSAGGRIFDSYDMSAMVATDDAGRFRIEGMPAGRVRVIAEARGWLRAEIGDLEVPEGRDLEGVRIVLREGARVEGRVATADGRPAIGVSVRPEVEGRRGFSSFDYALTDGDGRYRLDGIELGTQLIVAEDPELGRAAKELEVAPGANTLDLRFASGVPVSGRVVDTDGAPLPRAEVQLLGSSRSWRGAGVQSGEDGGFRIERVREGSYVLRVTREGFASYTREEPLQVGAGPVSGLEIRLGPGGAIVGAVTGLEPPELAALEILAFRMPGQLAAGEVDRDGRYRIPDLAPGEWIVRAELPDGRQAIDQVEVPEGALETALDLDFGSGLALTGVVLSAGEPQVGLSVVVYGADVLSGSSVQTDHEGRFRVEGLSPGRHRLQIGGFRGGTLHREEIDLAADRDVVVEIAAGSVSGTVLDAGDLEPLAGTVISLQQDQPPADFEWGAVSSGTSTDSEGRFFLEASTGDYRLRAVKEGYAPFERQVSVIPGVELEGLELRLEPTRGLDLVVRLRAGGVPTQVRYALLEPGGRVAGYGSQPADDSGLVRLATAPAGSFELLLSADGAAVKRLPVEIPGATIPVILEPSCRLEVVVAELREDQTAARVRLYGPDGNLFLRPGWSPEPGEDWPVYYGHAVLEGLPEGSYSVRIEATDGRLWESSATVAPGPPTRLDL